MHTNDVLIRTGVELGKVDILLGVKVCRGYVRHVDSTITKTYADEEQVFALQSIIRKRPVPTRLQGSQAAAESDVPASAALQEGQKVGGCCLGSAPYLHVPLFVSHIAHSWLCNLNACDPDLNACLGS